MRLLHWISEHLRKDNIINEKISVEKGGHPNRNKKASLRQFGEMCLWGREGIT